MFPQYPESMKYWRGKAECICQTDGCIVFGQALTTFFYVGLDGSTLFICGECSQNHTVVSVLEEPSPTEE